MTSEGSLLLSEVYVSHKESELITKTKGGKEKKASRSKSRRGDTKQHKIKESIPELLFMNSKEVILRVYFSLKFELTTWREQG